MGENGSSANVFVVPRSVEARELVADAALGLVDSIDLPMAGSFNGTAYL